MNCLDAEVFLDALESSRDKRSTLGTVVKIGDDLVLHVEFLESDPNYSNKNNMALD